MNGIAARSRDKTARRSWLLAELRAKGIGGITRHEACELATSLLQSAEPLLDPFEVRADVDAVVAEAIGLGPLDALLADPSVTDLMVTGSFVWVERHGQLERTEVRLGAHDVERYLERIVGPLGLRLDRRSPFVDARLPDGSRVHAVIPPIALDGPALTIRRFPQRAYQLSDFTDPDTASELRRAVADRRSVLVSGPTGAGKTSLLVALAASIGPTERVITIEDTAELRLPIAHVTRLEGRPATIEGPAAVTLRELLRNALRMRPDRLVVGEVRGGEAFDLLQALNTGHRGGLSTIHANSVDDALRRFETMVLLADVGLPIAAVRRQISGSLDLVVQMQRTESGARVITEVARVEAGPNDELLAVPLGLPCRGRELLPSSDSSRREQRSSAEPEPHLVPPAADGAEVRHVPTR